jgi:hypothetical protein
MTRRHVRDDFSRPRWQDVAVAALAVTTLLLMSMPMRAQTSDPGERRARGKLDRRLQVIVDDGGHATQRVIVRAMPGKMRDLRDVVDTLGHDVLKELVSIQALVAEVPADGLLELAAEPSVASISSDGPVRPHRPADQGVPSDLIGVTIVTARGRAGDVTDDLAMHRDLVTHLEGQRIAARVHRGDIEVLARHPAIVSIIVDGAR